MTVTLDQSPDHVATVGDTVVIDGDPYLIVSVEPLRHEPSFLDYGQVLRYSRVRVTVERVRE